MMNSPLVGLLILVTVALSTIAQTLLKLGADGQSLNIYLLGGVCLYGLSAIFYIVVLGKFNLSVAYPLVIGLTMIATTISSAIILREKIPLSQWLAIGLILSGVSAIAFTKPT